MVAFHPVLSLLLPDAPLTAVWLFHTIHTCPLSFLLPDLASSGNLSAYGQRLLPVPEDEGLLQDFPSIGAGLVRYHACP